MSVSVTIRLYSPYTFRIVASECSRSYSQDKIWKCINKNVMTLLGTLM
jgi:hypothetical protein